MIDKIIKISFNKTKIVKSVLTQKLFLKFLFHLKMFKAEAKCV